MRTKIIKTFFFLIIVGLFIFFGISYIKKTEISLPIPEERNWSSPINISHVPPPVSIKEGGRVIYPKSPILATDNSNILNAIWIEQEKEGIKETLEREVWDWRFNIKKYLAYSFKKNEIWSKPIKLFEFDEIQSYYITKTKNFTKLALVTDKNDTLHLIWSLTEIKYESVKRGETPTTRFATLIKDEGIFYSQKLKDGKWSEPEEIFNPQERGQDRISQILLAADSNCQPCIICRLPDYSIYQITKDENNNWFSSPLMFRTSNGILAQPKYFWATVDNKDNWHLVWSEKREKIYYTFRPKEKIWQKPIEISQEKELHLISFFAAALDKKGNLHFAWRDARSPNPIIYAFKPKNETLSDLVYLSGDSHDFSGYEWGVRLVLNSNNIPHIIWIGGEFKIIYITQFKKGSWSEPVIISNNLGKINREPYLIGSEEALHLVFMSGEGTSENIFYSFKPLK